MQETKSNTILEGYSEREKGAYLGAIAALATADRKATEEELDFLEDLSEGAGLSASQREAVLRAAVELSGDELTQCIEVLKASDLRFSLVADLIAFAEVDNNYSPEEREFVERITKALGVNKTQFSLLDQFVQRSAQSGRPVEEASKAGFLDTLGLRDQFSQAGINTPSMGRGLLGMLGPMLLAGMVMKGSRRRRHTGYGTGMGFPGGMMGGGGMGGFGSIFSALTGRRRSSSGMGSLLSRMLR